MKQEERQARSREEIYRAALEEFGAGRYEGANMEQICGRHGISKGMMYHYFANKDELFLFCVERVFRELEAYVQREAEALTDENAVDAIRSYFMLRVTFFQSRPSERVVFENAVLYPPPRLEQEIARLHAPLLERNNRFLAAQLSRIPLRPGLDAKQAERYLVCVSAGFRSFLLRSLQQGEDQTFCSLLQEAGKMLDMILFGVFRQPEAPSSGEKAEKCEETLC